MPRHDAMNDMFRKYLEKGIFSPLKLGHLENRLMTSCNSMYSSF